MSTPIVVGANVKQKDASKLKGSGRSSKEKDSSKKSSSKSKSSSESQKKAFKIVIRKLPVRDFSIDDFRTSLSRVLAGLGHAAAIGNGAPKDGIVPDVENDLVQIEHFIEGKLRYQAIEFL